ncbi:MAG: hypothetical protein ACO3YO_08160 [Chthoniobacterales bacterium]|jgi:hypothetical protein
MEIAGQAGHTALFGIGLWLQCALAGAAIGAAVGAIQIYPGRWHPAWATKLVYWFSVPFFAGLATGVLLALKSVPPLAPARTLWLVLCLIIAAATATLAAAVLAYLSRNYDPDAGSKAKRVTRRARGHRRATAHPDDWEDRLRTFFRPAPTNQESPVSAGSGAQTKKSRSVVPGQRATLPPERFPAKSELAKPPHYAGHPRHVRTDQGKLEKPIR